MGCMITWKQVKGRKTSTESQRLGTEKERTLDRLEPSKSATGEVLMKDEYIRERWGQYFSWLMIEKNPRVETEDRAPNQGMTSPVSEAEIERARRGMKCGKAVGSDEIPVDV